MTKPLSYETERNNEIWELKQSGSLLRDIAAKFGISKTRVCQILLKERKKKVLDKQ